MTLRFLSTRVSRTTTCGTGALWGSVGTSLTDAYIMAERSAVAAVTTPLVARKSFPRL